MHEASLIAGLLRAVEAVASEQGGGKVVGVAVKLGALSHISLQHFRDHFAREAKGTILDGARLDIEVLTDTADARAQGVVLESVELEV